MCEAGGSASWEWIFTKICEHVSYQTERRMIPLHSQRNILEVDNASLEASQHQWRCIGFENLTLMQIARGVPFQVHLSGWLWWPFFMYPSSHHGETRMSSTSQPPCHAPHLNSCRSSANSWIIQVLYWYDCAFASVFLSMIYDNICDMCIYIYGLVYKFVYNISL